MKRFNQELPRMVSRWRKVLSADKQFRLAFPECTYRNSRVERGGPGRMRKHRPYEGCGCDMCQWEKHQKGGTKKIQALLKYEAIASGTDHD